MFDKSKKRFVLPPLPEHLRVDTSKNSHEYVSKWFVCEEAGILKFRFGKKIFDVNLNIPVGDGTLLTSPEHKKLYNLVKQWIHEQHYPRTSKLAHMKIINAKKRLWNILRILDKLFLNAKSLTIYKNGFGNITPGTINSYLDEFIKSNSAHESIYSWPETLRGFLLKAIASPCSYDYEKFVSDNPIFVEPIPELTQRVFGMSDSEIFRARVWMYHEGYYQATDGEKWPGHIRTTDLVKVLYPNAIMAQHMRPLPNELEIQSVTGYLRALPAIPVRQENLSATALRYNEFRRGLMSQKYLPPSPLKIPELSLSQLSNNDSKEFLSKVGSYVTLPHYMTIDVLRKSILFYDTHSESILGEMSSLIAEGGKKNVRASQVFSDKKKNLASGETMAFQTWDLSAGINANPGNDADSVNTTRMKNMEGALQAYYLLMGCIQYVVGFFTARRQSELLRLKFKDLNPLYNCITVQVMKTGIGENRLTHDIPVIPLVMKMLKRLERFHLDSGLEHGYVANSTCFGRFSTNKKSRINKAMVKPYNSHMDILCDYFDTDTIEGRRFYVRQHQLRRAFAISFFYLNTKGSLSVLSYYYGHMDFKQIYRYLTTTIGNKEMLDVKAAYLAEEAITGNPISQDLLQSFGDLPTSTDLKVFQRDRLEGFYHSLLQEKDIEVTPTFLKVNEHEDLLIAINVRRFAHGQ